MRKAKTQEPEGFADYWAIWLPHCRKTDGRGKARPAYQHMIEAGADPRDILDGAAWYLRTLTERDAPYIPLAASWLRSERWADDCHKEREFQARRLQSSLQANVVPITPRGQTKFLREQWPAWQGGK